MSDLDADFLSTKELCLADVYHLERNFHPDLIIDGGGNVGLFTLRAAAAMRSDDGGAIKIVVCEPLPRNVEQIQRHLTMNKVDAEVLPYCLGGERKLIPFYCRGANQSSFDPAEAYEEVVEIPVVLLQDVIGSHSASRLLIKLDIEGMEVDVLDAFVPTEKRAVYIVGELHDIRKNASKVERIFHENGWTFELMDADTETSGFRACSPAAKPMLEWALPNAAGTVMAAS
jgi:FkbM family methyltransferase